MFAHCCTNFQVSPKNLNVSRIFRFTFKILHTRHALKNWRVQNYMQMQAKFSAGNDCLRFPHVTGGNLPAPAGNLCEVVKYLLCMSRWIISSLGTSPLSSTKEPDRSNHMLPLKSMVRPSKMILFQKVGRFIDNCSIRYRKKYSSLNNFSLWPTWSRTACCYFFNFFHIYRVWEENFKQN